MPPPSVSATGVNTSSRGGCPNGSARDRWVFSRSTTKARGLVERGGRAQLKEVFPHRNG